MSSKQVLSYLKYRAGSVSEHGIHSPFVFDLVTKVFKDKTRYPCYTGIEELRKKMKRDERSIRVTDLGAGSKKLSSSERKVRDICKASEKQKKYAQLLFRIVGHFKPGVIFDLGTSLGLTTLYLSEGNPEGNVITIEGCPETAAVANENFECYGVKNIQQVIGNFDDVLKHELDHNCQSRGSTRDGELASPLQAANLSTGALAKVDSKLFFFDGNHRKEPTLRYFEQCMKYANNDSIFIFDDIHWSKEMEEAWTVLKKDPRVTVTIDLFEMGIVFLRNEQAKEHFSIRF